MRICIFTDSFHPFVSGVSVAVLNQANGLAARGHEVGIFRPRPSRRQHRGPVPGLDERVRVHDVPVTLPTWAFPQLRIALPTFLTSWGALRSLRPDVVHVHTEFGCGWEGLLLARMRDVPVVGTFHTFFAEPQYLRHFWLPNVAPARHMVWRYSVSFFNRCHAVITPSRAVKEALVDKGLARCASVLSNGIAPALLQPRAQLAARRAELGLQGPTFVYVGRLAPEKSLDVTLRAFAQVHAARPAARLLLIGSGPQEAALRALAAELGIAEAVVWMGFVPNEQLKHENLLRLGDAFVTGSITENQPVSLLEAMSFGLPLVGPAAKGVPELIESGRNGFLYPPGDHAAMGAAMARLADEPALREACAAGSLAAAAEHSLSGVAEQLEQLYCDLVQRHAPALPTRKAS